MTPAETLARSLDLLHAAMDRGARRKALEGERERLDDELTILEWLVTDDPGVTRWPRGLGERLQEIYERQAEIARQLIALAEMR